MIFLPENDIQKKRSGQNDDRERYWLEPARGSLGGRGAEVSSKTLNLSTSWLSRGCASMRGGGLPQALVTGVECEHQRQFSRGGKWACRDLAGDSNRKGVYEQTAETHAAMDRSRIPAGWAGRGAIEL
jgi:hypothetical protein